MAKVQIIKLTAVHDARGLLTALQHPGHLPFVPVRVFIVTESPAGTERGGHAHRTCHQVLIATAGTIIVEYDDETGTRIATLSGATEGLHIPPLVWAKQMYATDGASLVVLASHVYDESDYVDDRKTAKSLRSSGT